MAQRTIVHLVDDVSGEDADETVAFALDGQPYEIDLSADNAARLRERLAEFVASARKSSAARRARPPFFRSPFQRHRRRPFLGPRERLTRSASAAAFRAA